MRLTTSDMSKITGISASYFYAVMNGGKFNPTLEVMEKIYRGTREKYGVGLRPDEYLESEIFNK